MRALIMYCLLLVAAVEAYAQEEPTEWSLVLHYGAGAPKDSGQLGHCKATFTSDGNVLVVSKRLRGDMGLRDVVLYRDKLKPDQLQAFYRAAEAALKEAPYRRRGANEDGYFLVLERMGKEPALVQHKQMNDFLQAPPAMLQFLSLLGDLLPNQGRLYFGKRLELKQGNDP
jgi:hypothetical protein